jgi:hypothetical protein
MRYNQQPPNFFFLLQIAAVLTLFGFAWLCFTGKSPLAVLYWNEQWLSSIVQTLSGMSWKEYLASPATARFWQWVEWGMGSLLALSAISVIGSKFISRISAAFLFAGAFIILLFSVLYGFDKIFIWVQTPEYALQWGTPMLLAVWLLSNNKSRILSGLRIAAAITFAAHGLYALGLAPRPGNFIEMTMSILPVSQSTAGHFLTLAGILDVVVAILVLLPFPKWQRVALVYMVFWGLLTTLARWAAHVHFDLPWWPQTFLAWTPEVLIRTSHFLIPLALLRR